MPLPHTPSMAPWLLFCLCLKLHYARDFSQGLERMCFLLWPNSNKDLHWQNTHSASVESVLHQHKAQVCWWEAWSLFAANSSLIIHRPTGAGKFSTGTGVCMGGQGGGWMEMMALQIWNDMSGTFCQDLDISVLSTVRQQSYSDFSGSKPSWTQWDLEVSTVVDFLHE